MTQTTTHRYIGITDETDTCEHCGREGLKRVVVLALLDSDGNVEEYTRYGTTCAARALSITGGGREVARAAGFAQYRTQEEAGRARRWFAKWGVGALDLDDSEAVTTFAKTYRRAQWDTWGKGDSPEVNPGGVTLARWVEIVTDVVSRYRLAVAENALIRGA